MFWITNKDYQEDIVALPKADDIDYKVGEGLVVDPEDGVAYPLPEAPSPEEAETFYAPQYISAVTLSAGSSEELLAYKVTQEAEIKVLCVFSDGVPNVGDEIYPINAQICVSGLNTSPTAKGHIIIEDLNGCDEKSTITYMGNTAPGGEITVRIFPTPSIDIEEGGGADLPEVNSDDNGKVLTVVDGEWDKADASSGLPEVSPAVDYNKALMVSYSGVWVKSNLPQYKIANHNVIELKMIGMGSKTLGAGETDNYTGDINSSYSGDANALVVGIVVTPDNPKLYSQGTAYLYSSSPDFPATINNKLKFDITLTNTSSSSIDVNYTVQALIFTTKNVYADVVS